MYVIYEEHIEKLEEENADLKQEVLILKRRLRYYQLEERGKKINKTRFLSFFYELNYRAKEWN